MLTNTKSGHYMVEAAIFVPLFIIAMLTVGGFIKTVGAAENIIFASCDEARYASQEAYIHNMSLQMQLMTNRRLSKEVRDLKTCGVIGMRYRYSKNGISDLITMVIGYSVNNNLPLKLVPVSERSVVITNRAFVGAGPDNGPMAFTEMENDGSSETVYVFPEYGECYHKLSCTYLSSHPVQIVLTPKIRREYKPCVECDAQSLPDGSFVYCFMKYGRKYHRKSCRYVNKYYIPMEKQEAEGRGFAPCSKCGGI